MRRLPMLIANMVGLLLSSVPSVYGGAPSTETSSPGEIHVSFRREVVNLESLAAQLVRAAPQSVRRPPPAKGDLWFGEIPRQLPDDDIASRRHHVAFAVLFEGTTAVRAWCDTNLNGDLSDDPEAKLSLYPGSKPARSFLGDLHWSVPYEGTDIPIDRLTRIVVESPDSLTGPRNYRVQSVFGMLGSLDLDGSKRSVLLFDANQDGLYSKGKSDGVFFDLDGDRHFTIDLMAPEFGPLAVPFSMGRNSYVVDAVDAQGAEMALHVVGPATESTTPAVGDVIPDFAYTDLQGLQNHLAGYRGNPVAVYFWASWCGACKRQAEALRLLYERYRNSRVEILGVSYDTDRNQMQRFREENGQSWPTSFTGGLPAEDPVGRLFREPGAGVFYVVAPDGRLAAKVYDVDELDLQLRKLVGREARETRSAP